MDQTPDQIAQTQWWRLLRRSVGIPDIITETRREEDGLTNDELAVANRLLAFLPSDGDVTISTGHYREIAKIARAFAHAGATGRLDAYLTSREPEEAEEATAVNQIFSLTTTDRIPGIGRALLHSVTDYLKAHPFVDDCGHPFG
jgi:hypothetical protein